MNNIRPFFFFAFLLSHFFYTPTIQAQNNYKLIWSDEFTEAQLDTNTWVIWEGSAYNNELQCYTGRDQNIFIENEKLHLQAVKEEFQCGENRTLSYTSARISTDSTRVGWEYGRFETKMKMPLGKGFWPAFWMMPMREIGWPKGGEIDILEYRGNQPSTHVAAMHFWRKDCDGDSSQCIDSVVNEYEHSEDLSEEFHIYALEWTPNELRWYLDDTVVQRVDLNALDAEHNPFTGPFHIILNLAVGGNFLPNPDDSTPFPSALIVDYLRVYELK